MFYEKEIPEYALQPAKAPQFVQAEAIYHTENLSYPVEKKTTVLQIEEDILVPDTKADMQNIFFIHAGCDIQPEEKKISPKTDDFVQLTGMITLQTLYQPEDDKDTIIGITSKVPYKYAWNLTPEFEGDGFFSCHVKTLDYMVINERKFRVKITLEFVMQLFRQQELRFFDGLKDESLEMKKAELPLVCLALVKKDQIYIEETISLRDTELIPENILKQSFLITENYRQVTTEKIVINGFLLVNLLYQTKGEDGQPGELSESHERIEFTQFIPIDKEHRDKKWSTVKTSFVPKNLSVTKEKEDGETQSAVLRVQGEIEVRVELYEVKGREVVIDAYHREKNFHSRYQRVSFRNLTGSNVSACSLREIINLKDAYKAEKAIGCDCRVATCSSSFEKGKPVVEGSIEAACLWKDSEGNCHITKQTVPFRQMLEGDFGKENQFAECSGVIKTAFLSLINEKQLELNAVVLICCDTFEEKELVLLEEPGFTMEERGKDFPMMITALNTGETLWDLAKRCRTTEEKIRDVNRFVAEPEPGQKILVMR